MTANRQTLTSKHQAVTANRRTVTANRQAVTRIAWLVAAGLAVVACRTGAGAVAKPGPSTTERGWQAFTAVAAVLQSPRCVSCHVAGDVPLQGDQGHLHTMNVKRGADGRGTPVLRCTSCHQTENVETPHAPPGAPDWRLPPPAMRMAWQGLGAEALCVMLKDPARNGGRSLAALEAHLRDDALVAWGFRPGPGRQPPPVSQPELLARFASWKDAGAPCTASDSHGR
jgi:hypothetical protein